MQRPYGWEGQTIEDAPFLGLGDAAGDQGGAAIDTLDWDHDGVPDLAVGAPGADAGGSGSGAVYLVPGPG